ncbi:MAG: nucleotide exchange factor GrpE [Candidatus Pacebacteria bacterium]|nr:nucleotide exchange factor GrpE [Candidatus Paceibacterota bacterium]
MKKDNEKKEELNEDVKINEGIDDIIIESEEEEQNSFGDNATKKLREKLKKCTEEKQEYLSGWQRSKADLINARKEFGEEKLKLSKFANSDLILQIIPTLDSFEMALGSEKDESVLQEWIKGFEHIYSQLLSILEINGVQQINPLNEKFDPNLHTSIEVIEVDNSKDVNIILEVIQKGYMLNEKVIREAKVKVGELKK